MSMFFFFDARAQLLFEIRYILSLCVLPMIPSALSRLLWDGLFEAGITEFASISHNIFSSFLMRVNSRFLFIFFYHNFFPTPPV